MPIYEFYCGDCHTIYNFFSRTFNTTKQPDCPRCHRPKLERQVSRFAISKGQRKESDQGDDELPDLDEAKLERAMAEMERDADGMNEDDPRQMARMMRKLYDAAGLQIGGGMEEAMRRLETGEDPDKIEEEMGDVLEGEEPLFGASGGGIRGLARKLRPPRVDETLYDL
jgi:putative FmdB family regulatory protein